MARAALDLPEVVFQRVIDHARARYAGEFGAYAYSYEGIIVEEKSPGLM
jgi:hypothetical protein